MKRIVSLFLSICLMFGFCSCGQEKDTSVPVDALTWQEQYDLGIRYLNEGNYQEAILAFTAAISIDPKRPENYRSLAEAYTSLGDTEKALEILRQGFDLTGDEGLGDRIAQLERETDGFCISEKFYPSDRLPQDVQALLHQWMDLLIAEQPEVLEDEMLATDSAVFEGLTRIIDYEDSPRKDVVAEILTMIDGYKLKLYHSVSNSGQILCKFEIRPREGEAAFCHMWLEDGLQNGRHAAGECSSWNWNGVYELRSYSERYTQEEEGTVSEGFLDGEVQQQLWWPDGRYEEAYISFTKGSMDGEWVDGSFAYAYIYGPGGEKIYTKTDANYQGEQWCHVYWTGASGMIVWKDTDDLDWS